MLKMRFTRIVIAGNHDAVNPAVARHQSCRTLPSNGEAGETISHFCLRLAAMIDKHPYEAPFADFDANFTSAWKRPTNFTASFCLPNSRLTPS